jgi:hypothetical protein
LARELLVGIRRGEDGQACPRLSAMQGNFWKKFAL